MQKSFIIVLITAVIVAIFAVLNADPVTVNLLFAEYQLSQAVVILVSAVLGALAMFLMNMIQVVKLRRQVKQLSKKVIDAEGKNAALAAENKVLTTPSNSASSQIAGDIQRDQSEPSKHVNRTTEPDDETDTMGL